MVFGVRCSALTVFDGVRWRRSCEELRSGGADEVKTDDVHMSTATFSLGGPFVTS